MATPGSPWWAEGRSRYHLVGSAVVGRTVLDVACGAGLGLDVLVAAGARSVIGADLDAHALQRLRAGGDRTAPPVLCRVDAARLPFAPASFDVITSFETMEHLPDPEPYLEELGRTIRPDGTVFLSTPNALFTRPVDGVPANPFHVREYTPAELIDVLAAHFGEVELLGQRPAPQHRPCPYWEHPETFPADARARAGVAAWKLLARLGPVGRRASPLLLRRSLHPGEHDFTFLPADVALGHDLVARLQRPRRR